MLTALTQVNLGLSTKNANLELNIFPPQVAFEDVPLTNSHIIAGVLVMLGIWIHGNFPYKLQKSIKKA